MPSEYTSGDTGKVHSTGHGLGTTNTDDKVLVSSALVSWGLQKITQVPQLQRNGYSTYYKPKNNSQLHHEAVVTRAMYSTIAVLIIRES